MVAGVGLVALTSWDRLDPIIALLVAANIVVTGVSLVRRFTGGLMDRALPPEQRATIEAVLERYADERVQFHALRTRSAGPRAFVSVHVLVPGDWTVQRATRPRRAGRTRPKGRTETRHRLHAPGAPRGPRFLR